VFWKQNATSDKEKGVKGELRANEWIISGLDIVSSIVSKTGAGYQQ